jgi:hypothetical protein
MQLTDRTVRDILELRGGVVPSKLSKAFLNKRFGTLNEQDLLLIAKRVGEVAEAQEKVASILNEITELLAEDATATLADVRDHVRASELVLRFNSATALLEKLGGSL